MKSYFKFKMSILVVLLTSFFQQNVFAEHARYIIQKNNAEVISILTNLGISDAKYSFWFSQPQDDIFNFANEGHFYRNDQFEYRFGTVPFSLIDVRILPQKNRISLTNLSNEEAITRAKTNTINIARKVMTGYLKHNLTYAYCPPNCIEAYEKLPNGAINYNYHASFYFDIKNGDIKIAFINNTNSVCRIKDNVTIKRDIALSNAMHMLNKQLGLKWIHELDVIFASIKAPYIISDLFGVERLIYHFPLVGSSSENIDSWEKYKSYSELCLKNQQSEDNDMVKKYLIDVDAQTGEVLPGYPDISDSLLLFPNSPKLYLDKTHIQLNYMPMVVKNVPYICDDYLNNTLLWRGNIDYASDGDKLCEISYQHNKAIVTKNAVTVIGRDNFNYRGAAPLLQGGKIYLDCRTIAALTDDEILWDKEKWRLDINTKFIPDEDVKPQTAMSPRQIDQFRISNYVSMLNNNVIRGGEYDRFMALCWAIVALNNQHEWGNASDVEISKKIPDDEKAYYNQIKSLLHNDYGSLDKYLADKPVSSDWWLCGAQDFRYNGNVEISNILFAIGGCLADGAGGWKIATSNCNIKTAENGITATFNLPTDLQTLIQKIIWSHIKDSNERRSFLAKAAMELYFAALSVKNDDEKKLAPAYYQYALSMGSDTDIYNLTNVNRLYNLGKTDEAYTFATNYLQSHHSAQATNDVASFYKKVGKNTEALAAYQRAIANDNDANVRLVNIAYLTSMQQLPAINTNTLLYADNLLFEKKYDLAKDSYLAIIDDQQRSPAMRVAAWGGLLDADPKSAFESSHALIEQLEKAGTESNNYLIYQISQRLQYNVARIIPCFIPDATIIDPWRNYATKFNALQTWLHESADLGKFIESYLLSNGRSKCLSSDEIDNYLVFTASLLALDHDAELASSILTSDLVDNASYHTYKTKKGTTGLTLYATQMTHAAQLAWQVMHNIDGIPTRRSTNIALGFALSQWAAQQIDADIKNSIDSKLDLSLQLKPLLMALAKYTQLYFFAFDEEKAADNLNVPDALSEDKMNDLLNKQIALVKQTFSNDAVVKLIPDFLKDGVIDDLDHIKRDNVMKASYTLTDYLLSKYKTMSKDPNTFHAFAMGIAKKYDNLFDDITMDYGKLLRDKY